MSKAALKVTYVRRNKDLTRSNKVIRVDHYPSMKCLDEHEARAYLLELYVRQGKRVLKIERMSDEDLHERPPSSASGRTASLASYAGRRYGSSEAGKSSKPYRRFRSAAACRRSAASHTT